MGNKKRKGWDRLVNKTVEVKAHSEMAKDAYYSAEFSVNGLGTVYQFRLWKTDSKPMCVLVREDSNLLPWLRVGDGVNGREIFFFRAFVLSCLRDKFFRLAPNTLRILYSLSPLFPLTCDF